jgi:hypothetical protein
MAKKKSKIRIGNVKGDVTISQDQSGGTTAHETRTASDKKPSKSKWSTIKVIGIVAAIVTILTYLGIKPGEENNMPKNEEEKISIGDVNGNVVISQNQSGGITAHTVNVNQQRAISPQAQVKKEKRENKFILQVILNQTSGVWDPSTMFKLRVKTSGPYQTAGIVKGLPSAQFEVRIAEDKENGVFAYSTRTAPLNDEPIILEIQSVSDIDLVELSVEPLAKNK